jgi:hypothetical protein
MLEKCRHGDDIDRFNPMQIKEVGIAADQPAYSRSPRTCDEFGIVWIPKLLHSRRFHPHRFDEWQQFFFDQAADLRRSQFELRVGEDSQILIEDLG